MKTSLSVSRGQHAIGLESVTGCDPLPDLYRVMLDDTEITVTIDPAEARWAFQRLLAMFTPRPPTTLSTLPLAEALFLPS
jgi:hypothetical protein